MSIFLIALGAVLKFAVTATVAGISIQTAGLILMLVGVLGLVIGLFMLASDRRRTTREVRYEERPTYEDRPLYR
jgi:beta-lactamase regulating signal transducer with metallopeptidase domain